MSKSNEMQNIIKQAEYAIRIREATPGMPADGPYPATVEEVAEELYQLLRELEGTYAQGIIDELYELLFYHIRGRDIK